MTQRSIENITFEKTKLQNPHQGKIKKTHHWSRPKQFLPTPKQKEKGKISRKRIGKRGQHISFWKKHINFNFQKSLKKLKVV